MDFNSIMPWLVFGPMIQQGYQPQRPDPMDTYMRYMMMQQMMQQGQPMYQQPMQPMYQQPMQPMPVEVKVIVEDSRPKWQQKQKPIRAEAVAAPQAQAVQAPIIEVQPQ